MRLSNSRSKQRSSANAREFLAHDARRPASDSSAAIASANDLGDDIGVTTPFLAASVNALHMRLP